MAVSKVVYGSSVLLDLTNDTVALDCLNMGKTAHDRSGNRIIGTSPGFPPIEINQFTVGPDDSDLNGAYEALKTAISYWNAKNSGTRYFQYSDGDGALKGDQGIVNDSFGNAVMDCSTYMGLILRGYSYLDSVYSSNQDPNARVDSKTIVAKDLYWVENYLDKQTDSKSSNLGQKTSDGYFRCLTAADLCAFYEMYHLTWLPGERTVLPGDLAFFNKYNSDGTLVYSNRWRGMSHVGLMTDENHFLNITDYADTGNLIRTSVNTRPPIMYARPLYTKSFKAGKNYLTTNSGINLIPSVCSGLSQGSSSVNGINVTCNNLSIVFSGKPNSGISRDIIGSACPLQLPKGTYKLSGCHNNSGTNTVSPTHSLWGMRVYNADTGGGIPGTTWSSNGSNSSQRTPVWDIGGGAQFEISENTLVNIDFYVTSSRDISGISFDPKLEKIG